MALFPSASGPYAESHTASPNQSKEIALVRVEFDKDRLTKEDATLLMQDFMRSYVDTKFFK